MTRLILIAWALLLCWPAFGGVRIVVPAHDIPRGAMLEQSDLTYATAPDNLMTGTVVSMSDVIGMQTRRVLRAGESLRLDDVRRPILVTRGSTVTMTFEAPGITLTAMGRAMNEGGLGDTITVQNPASYRQVSAIVVAPGQVRAAAAAPRLASADHP
ncbi:MAG: flagellar basal body P-ring formation protein FlgA [Alphaproteobacteria bacterium]|nr:flagellar basal body P-ring formation protein FlgA [Alphaproteobacteria bacterium]